MTVVHKSRVDGWIAVMLAVPPLSSLLLVSHGEILWGFAAIAGYGLLLAAIALPLRYVVDPDSLTVRYGVLRQHIPWDRVIGMTPSSNPLSSPALSLRRLEVAYRKPDGAAATLLISPRDRAAFVADCAAASKRHRAEGETLV